MQLHNHVVEDHLDYNFAWPDDSIFDQQFQWNDEYGIGDNSTAIPRTENYPSCDITEGHQQMPYYYPTASSARVDYSATGALEQDATPFGTLKEHQDHHTFEDRVQPAWPDSESIHQPRTSENNGYSASEASNPFSSTYSAANFSEHGFQTSGHVCNWIIESRAQSLCNQTFNSAEALQKHLQEDHCKLIKKSRLDPKIPAICYWAGCGRKGEPLTDAHKLVRHVLTHSD
ncbi:MAG: hypothetical protein Q9225_007731, partial [Loekoesia sp. 1 TL-2023]